ncbi:MAG: hypothetical protein M3328_06645, partial [Chloroflexota bacterium]|nr:hypothetical protein [Chloroflexota bacterium]
RRLLEALPQVDTHPEDVGLLLVGRGHTGTAASTVGRQTQEYNFQRRVRQALVRAGFPESRVVIGSLRAEPRVAEALQTLIGEGCKAVFWMPSTYSADGISTLYDIPAEIEPVARNNNVKLIALGGWNADDLAAEEIASRVREVSGAPARRSL